MSILKDTTDVKTIVKNKRCSIYSVMIVVYTLILFMLNFMRIFDNNFWGDECFSIRLAKMTMGDMIATTAGDVHPPLYYIFVMIAYHLFGSHGWLYHSVSLIPYIIELIIGLSFIRKEFGQSASIIFITYVSFMRTSLVYNVEVRMYSWAALFVLLSYLSYYMIIKCHRKRDYICFIIFSLAAAYTHYYALMAVAFFYLFLMVRAFYQKKYIKEMLVTCALTILGYAYWFVVLITTFSRTSDSFWLQTIPRVKDCFDFIFNPSDNNIVLCIIILVFVVTVFVSYKKATIDIDKDALAQDDKSESSGSLTGRELIIWETSGLCSLFGTMIVGEMFSHMIRPMFQVKYLFPAAVIVWLLIGINIGRLKYGNYIALGLVMFILITGVSSDKTLYVNDREHNRILSETLTAINSEIKDDDVILTDVDHLNWTILDYYYPQNDHVLVSDGEIKVKTGHINWLILHDNIDENEVRQLKKMGLSYMTVYEKGIIGCNQVYVYRISGR